MVNWLHHENLHRSADIMERLQTVAVTVCGAGALGANLIENLARQGFANLRVIDRDRVEERNLSTQPFYRSDIGGMKAKLLANAVYRAVGVTVDAQAMELKETNVARLLNGVELVIDCFDNSAARRTVTEYCDKSGVACLHVGLAQGYAEILWNTEYRVPSDTQDDVCDYPLARNLVGLAVAAASEIIVGYLANGEQRAVTVTLGDLSIQAFGG